jgi:hypothetical protein
MNLKKRIDRLAPKPSTATTVFVKKFGTQTGEGQVWQAVIIRGQGNTHDLTREPDETEKAFRVRVEGGEGELINGGGDS